MSWLISISILLIIIGAGFVTYAAMLPVYTDELAPERLSNELEAKPRETRFKEWYSRLSAYETPHKKLSDWGRGLCAGGVGLFLATRGWILYHRWPWMRTIWCMFLVWLVLWAIRIPFTIWFYWLREARFDYPIWGDSIGIPVISESITWIVGWMVSSLVLAVLLIRHPLPARIKLVRPRSAYSWVRAAFVVCWIAFLAVGFVLAIPDGDEGMVLTCSIASVVLLTFLSAPEVTNGDKSHKVAASPIAR
jgi:hypothetical protein